MVITDLRICYHSWRKITFCEMAGVSYPPKAVWIQTRRAEQSAGGAQPELPPGAWECDVARCACAAEWHDGGKWVSLENKNLFFPKACLTPHH